jgi:acyl-CoA synthetase (AMP-forming)/AMP-acid ligase II
VFALRFSQDSVSVENALYADDRVLEAAAVGVPDKRLGEQVTSVVSIKPAHHGRVTEGSVIAIAQKRCVHVHLSSSRLMGIRKPAEARCPRDGHCAK